MIHTHRRLRGTLLAAAVGTLSLGLAACSLSSGSPSGSSPSNGSQPGVTPGATSPSGGTTGATAKRGSGTVVLVTHDSFAAPKATLAAFTKQSGYTVKVQESGDAGQLTNKLVLTKNSPLGDAVFGIDNTFASRAVSAGILARHQPVGAPASLAKYALPDPTSAAELTPVDFGDVCVNIDDAWFAAKKVNPPKTLDYLTKPAYRGLFVTPGPATSSPGMAFLLTTIAKYGHGWQAYWKKLMANGTRVTSGWSDAYSVDFSGGEGKGDRPIVLSYSSSPPFTIPKGGNKPTTSALLDTCFRQVEYAGVLKGAKNPAGAAALVDFLVSKQFQQTIPDNMYVYPVNDQAKIPALWAKWATVSDKPYAVPPADIAKNRSTWLQQWSDIATG